MPTPDSSIITQLVRSMALANNQIGLQQNGRKPNNTFGSQQYNSSRPSTKKMQSLFTLDERVTNLFNQVNNINQITPAFFTNLNESLKNQTEASLIPITSTVLKTYYNDARITSKINFLATTKDSDGNQSFPLSKLETSPGEYFVFSNNYPTYITSGSRSYKLSIIQSGSDIGKLEIKLKSPLQPTYEAILGSPVSKGDSFNLGSNQYVYAGAGSPGIIFSTIPFPDIVVNVSDFLGTDNTLDPNNVGNDLISGTISNTLGSEKLCFPTNLSQGVTPNTFILHDRKRIAKISITLDPITLKEVPIITTLYTFPNDSTSYDGNMNSSCIQKDENTFFWTKGNSNLIYYTDDNFATEQTIGDPNYVYGNILGVLPTDNPPQFGALTKLIFNNNKTKIYVPDLYTSLLRIVDISIMSNIIVETVKNPDGTNVNFSSVIDVKEYTDNNLFLTIQTPKGGNQLILFNMTTKTIEQVFGNGEPAWVDSNKDNSSIFGNTGIAIDYANNQIYFTQNGMGIRMMDGSGNFYTVAGSTLGYENNGQLSKFNKLMGMLYDNTTQSLYVCDGFNYRIRKIKLVLKSPSPTVNCNYTYVNIGTKPTRPVAITLNKTINKFYFCTGDDNKVYELFSNGLIDVYNFGFEKVKYGIITDSVGNVYVTNSEENTISKSDFNTGDVTEFATGINQPIGITIDSSDNLYVCSFSDNTVYKVDTSGTISEFASGIIKPSALTIDNLDNLYVCSYFDNTVYKVNTLGDVSVYATGISNPQGIIINAAGNLYICSPETIYKVDYNRNVSVYARGFNNLYGIAVDSSDNLYVCDNGNNEICKVSPPPPGGNTIVTINGGGSSSVQFRIIGITPGMVTTDMQTRFSNDFADLLGIRRGMITIKLEPGSLIVDVTFDPQFGNGGYTDTELALIRNVRARLEQLGVTDITRILNDNNIYFTQYNYNSTFYDVPFLRSPFDADISSDEVIYMTDTDNDRICSIELKSGGAINKFIVGRANAPGFRDGYNISAQFRNPRGLVLDNRGNMYITDTGNHAIRKAVISTNYASTLSGNPNPGYIDGNIANARFNSPSGICIDSNNNLYISDSGNHRIRKININTGIVTTVAGDGLAGHIDGTGTNSRFNNPCGICIDLNGNLYIADSANHRIRKIVISTGVVTTIAGNGVPALVDADSPLSASFNNPYGVTIDNVGNLYIGDSGNNKARKFNTISGVITTLSSKSGIKDVILNNPKGVIIKQTGGALYIADHGNNRVTRMTAGIYIDYENIKVALDKGLISEITKTTRAYAVTSPMVGSEKRRCLYTVIGSSIVKINNNGHITKVAPFPNSNPNPSAVSYINITLDEDFLIIVGREFPPIFFCDIINGIVYNINLTTTSFPSGYGFNKWNNRFYFQRLDELTQQLKPYYIEIDPTNLTATPVKLNDIPDFFINARDIIFTSEYVAYMGSGPTIFRIYLDTHQKTRIVGKDPLIYNGIWKNAPPFLNPLEKVWGSSSGNGYPYKDGYAGTEAYVNVNTLCYDYYNDRLLFTDYDAQRIRSVDLRSGRHFVRTIAGTSPVLYGQAANNTYILGTNPQSQNNLVTTYDQYLLDSLGQVGPWENFYTGMPRYTKVNSSYLTSTFMNPSYITIYNNIIYVLSSLETRQLSNDRVSDFIPIALNISNVTFGLLGGGPSITFKISNSSFTLSDTEKQSFINEFMKFYSTINKNNLEFTFTVMSGTAILVNIKYKEYADAATLSNEELSTIQNLEVGFSDKVELLANFRTAKLNTTFTSGNINLDVGGTSSISGEINIIVTSDVNNFIDEKLPKKISPRFLQFGNDGSIYTTNGLNNILSVDRRFGFTNLICSLPPPTDVKTRRNSSSILGIDSSNSYLIVQDNLIDNNNRNLMRKFFYIIDISTKIYYQIKGGDFARDISGYNLVPGITTYNSLVNVYSIIFNKFNNKIYIDIRFLKSNFQFIGYFPGTFNYSTKTFSLDSNTPLSNFDYLRASNYNSIAHPTEINNNTNYVFINANEYICTINNQICRFNINTNLLTKIIGDLNLPLQKAYLTSSTPSPVWGKFNYQGPILFSRVNGLVNYNNINDTLFVCDSTAKVMLSISPILGTGTPRITNIYGTQNTDLDSQGYANSSIQDPIGRSVFFIDNLSGINKGTLSPNTLNFIYPESASQNVLDNRIYVAGYSYKLISKGRLSLSADDGELYETTVIVGNKGAIFKINTTSQ